MSKQPHPIQESVVLRAVLGIVVDILLHGWDVRGPQRWRLSLDFERLFTLVSILLGFVLSILLEQQRLPGIFRVLRGEMFRASNAAKNNRLLATVLQNLVSDVDARLSKLAAYNYRDTEAAVPQLSIDTIQRVERNAFATFVADSREHIYEDEAGRAYMNAWYKKVDQLRPASDTIVRLFITDEANSFTDEAFRLMEENDTK